MTEDFAVEWVRAASMEIRKLRAMKLSVETALPLTSRDSPERRVLEAAVHAYAVTP